MRTVYTITHPQALSAIWLANKLEGMSPGMVTRIINSARIPRRLFVLAGTLRANVGARA